MPGAGIEGGDRLVATLRHAGTELADLDDVNRAAGGLIHDVAVRTAPRASGTLDANLTTVVTAAGVGWSARPDYWIPVHFGTRYMRARPFYTDAIETNEAEIADLYADHITHTLNTVKGT